MAAVARLTQSVVSRPWEPNFVEFRRLQDAGFSSRSSAVDRQPSILAASTSMIGISS